LAGHISPETKIIFTAWQASLTKLNPHEVGIHAWNNDVEERLSKLIELMKSVSNQLSAIPKDQR
jgi:hypothetical protein